MLSRRNLRIRVCRFAKEPARAAYPFNRAHTIKGLVILAVVVGLFFTPLPKEIIALAAAGIHLASPKFRTEELLGLVEWPILVLFMGLFVVTGAFQSTGYGDQAVQWLAHSGFNLNAPAQSGAGDRRLIQPDQQLGGGDVAAQSRQPVPADRGLRPRAGQQLWRQPDHRRQRFQHHRRPTSARPGHQHFLSRLCPPGRSGDAGRAGWIDRLGGVDDLRRAMTRGRTRSATTKKTTAVPAIESGGHVLTVNGGSSSIKFALYQVGEPLKRGLHGKVDRIGLSGTNLTFHDANGKPQASRKLTAADHKTATNFLIDWFEEQNDFASVRAVGHRVVLGLQHTVPELITPELLDELHRISPCDPDHLPREIQLIEAFRQRHPKLPQLACFDTAFHTTMPRVAKLLPIPRRYEAKGIQRYGFHGLSYAYLMEELVRLGDPAATNGRVILAHLGNGASLAAVRDGQSIDTSMGFTPTSGLVMSTRSGDLDPGLVSYLARTEKMTAPQFDRMVNHDSGLLGVSETSSDMRDLLDHEAKDVRAAEAVALFCYQAKKWIGAYAAALGGLDTLVFAGGIGENAPLVRARICEELNFLGLELNEARNAEAAGVISTDASRVAVRVIRTDEELMIARSVSYVLRLGAQKKDKP